MIKKLWESKNIWSLLLTPLSYLYIIALKLYKIIRKEQVIITPIICVGNATLGGAGKTPVAIEIRKTLQGYFKNIFVLTRGYKGKVKGPILVDSSENFVKFGDESLIHVKQGKTCVSKNKYLGAKFCEDLGADLIIMDDGLQSIDVKKKIKILVVDDNYGFGNKRVFPSGPLRTTVKESIESCDIIIILGNKTFPKKNKFNHQNKTVYLAKKTLNANKFKNQLLYVFSALGNNKNFHNSLLNEGCKIKKIKEFPDHYKFTRKDISKILKEAREMKLKIVCTQKDFIKIPCELKDHIYPIDLEIRLKNHLEFKNQLLKMI
ncbi:MAG: tetraacyldisaccharide 4'-kinase [Alphaproteobacteria bacterium]